MGEEISGLNSMTEAMRADFIGYPLHTHTLEQTLDEIDNIIHNRRLVQHCVLNAYKLYLLNRDETVSRIVKNCALVQADGMSIVWIADLLGLPPVPRVTGIDLMDALVRRSAEKGHRIFFLGAKPEIIKKVVDEYVERYPTLQVAGYHHGYYTNEAEVVEEIRQSGADVLFVGFGSPQKEKFIHKNLQVMGVPFCMGVGGSFDVMAGLVNRAPMWIQRAGMEWFYRLAQEPRRLWKRYAYCHLDMARHIGKAFLTSIRPWQRLGFLLGFFLHVTLSFALTARAGWAGLAVSMVSLLAVPLVFKNPTRSLEVFLVFFAGAGLLMDSGGSAISPLLAPFSVVLWSFLRHRSIVHELRFLSFPGKAWLYSFFTVVLLSLLAATGRYGLLGLKGLPASVSTAGQAVAVENAIGWLALSTLGKSNGCLLFLLAIYLLKKVTHPELLFEKWINRLSLGFLVSLVVGYLQVFVIPQWRKSPAFVESTQISSTFSDPNAFAYSLVLILPLLLARIFSSRPGYFSKVATGILAGALLPLLFYAGSRSALLGFLLAGGLLGLLSCFRRRSLKPLFLLVVLAAGLVGIGLKTGVGSRVQIFRERKQNRTLIEALGDNRLNMWHSGWAVFQEHPVLGTGSGAYLLELPKVAHKLGNYYTHDNAGNQYLQLAAETGFLGLLFWLFFIGSILWSSLRAVFRPSPAYWRPFALASGLAMLVAFMYGPHTQILEVELLFSLTLALMTGWKENKRRDPGEQVRKLLIMTRIKPLTKNS